MIDGETGTWLRSKTAHAYLKIRLPGGRQHTHVVAWKTIFVSKSMGFPKDNELPVVGFSISFHIYVDLLQGN